MPPFQEALDQLFQHAELLISGNEPEKYWLSLMRNKAGELGLDPDVKDVDLQAQLDDAQRAANKGRVYRGGEKLQATEPTFLLDGLIQLGETNIVVGQPKVGKSSFSCGLIAALRDRRETFLGRDLALPSSRMPVLLFGTDQSEGNWLHFLRREGLVAEDQALDSNAIDFFCDIDSSDDYNFTKDGLKHMRAEIDQHVCPLVIIDSLNSMMEPTGMEENNSRYAQPIRNAIRELRKTGATLVIIHHTRKSPLTWDWITECRGSSSIASVMSWGVLMRWVSQEEEGLARTDKRVGFSGKGRGSGESGGVMAEYLAEGGWTYLDGLEAAQQVERVRQRIMELGSVRASVFDYLTMRSELNADVSTDELATELNKQRSHMARELQALKTKGLACVSRMEPTGGRPKPYWRLTDAAVEAMTLREGNNVNNGNKPLVSNKTIISNFQNEDLKPFPVGASVELLRNDQWQNGWVVHSHDGLTITAAKTGDRNRLIKNLRPDLDVRPCSSPFQAPADSRPDVSGGDTPVPVQGSDDSSVDDLCFEF